MKAFVSQSELKGTVDLPPSKSMMQRACALALLHKGNTFISNPGTSGDDEAALQIIASLGATVIRKNNRIHIQSSGIVNAPETVFCGESGLSLRMFAPLISLAGKHCIIDGTGSLLNRKIDFFDSISGKLGASFKTHNGFLPLHVNGKFVAEDLHINASESSQYLTGLLFAFAYRAKERRIIKVDGLVSKPYVEMSLQMLQHFGYHIECFNYCEFIIHPSEPVAEDIYVQIESDWSAASYFIVAAALYGDLTIRNLKLDSCQADRAILEVLNRCGVEYEFSDNVLLVKKCVHLLPFSFDATDCPDLFPSLVVLAMHAEGRSTIKGVSRLFNKESDRAAAIMSEFGALGASISIEDDVMHIEGGKELHQAEVHTHYDHRMAMALSIAGIGVHQGISIEDVESVSKSFPVFFEVLKACGGNVTLP